MLRGKIRWEGIGMEQQSVYLQGKREGLGIYKQDVDLRWASGITAVTVLLT
jgi:hypothetical protein